MPYYLGGISLKLFCHIPPFCMALWYQIIRLLQLYYAVYYGSAKKAKKLVLPAMIAHVNSRGAISGMQRKGRKTLQGKQGHNQVTGEQEEELDREASESIKAEGPITRH
jgi:hypothetical protein